MTDSYLGHTAEYSASHLEDYPSVIPTEVGIQLVGELLCQPHGMGRFLIQITCIPPNGWVSLLRAANLDTAMILDRFDFVRAGCPHAVPSLPPALYMLPLVPNHFASSTSDKLLGFPLSLSG